MLDGESARWWGMTMTMVADGRFAAWLRGAMARRGLSGVTLARHMLVQPIVVYDWMHGQATPGRHVVGDLADALDVTIGEVQSALRD